VPQEQQEQVEWQLVRTGRPPGLLWSSQAARHRLLGSPAPCGLSCVHLLAGMPNLARLPPMRVLTPAPSPSHFLSPLTCVQLLEHPLTQKRTTLLATALEYATMPILILQPIVSPGTEMATALLAGGCDGRAGRPAGRRGKRLVGVAAGRQTGNLRCVLMVK